MEQIASMGAAVSVVDFDRDGWDDIYVTNSGEGIRERALPETCTTARFGMWRSDVGLADMNSPRNGRIHGRRLGRLR